MAEEKQATTAQAPAEVVAVSDVPLAEPEKSTTKEAVAPPPPPVVEEEEPIKPAPAAVVEVVEGVESEKPKSTDEQTVPSSVSFKEESNRVSDLPDPERKALDELKQLIQQALNNHEFSLPPPPPPPVTAAVEEKPAEEAPPPVEEKPAASTAVPADVAASDVPPPIVEEPVKKVEEIVSESTTVKEEKVEEKTPPPPPPAAETVEAVVVTKVVETVAAVIDEDGAKTVEAIEETIVAVSPPAPPPAEPTPEVKETETSIESKEEEISAVPPPPPEEVFIWGIPILGDDRSDVILLKFLRARDFKVKDAFTMIKNTVRWRKEFGIDTLLEEDLGNDLDKVVFMHGFDKEGHPVCYNVYGEFQNKELYQKAFSDDEKRQKFLRWRIQFLEKSIEKLDFSPSGISTIVQVNDLKNSPGPGKRELRQATNQALSLLQDNYPEFVAKQIFINVPWWYLAFNRMISPFLTQRTRSKFVFAGPSKSAETLFKYVAPELVPVQYGGLSKEGDHEFTTTDAVIEVTVKPASKYTVEFPVSETCLLVWEVRVVGWDVIYGSEFVPRAEDGYTVIIEKARKVTSADEPVISNSFKIGEPGKVVITIDNPTSKKKKLLYRYKTKPSSD